MASLSQKKTLELLKKIKNNNNNLFSSENNNYYGMKSKRPMQHNYFAEKKSSIFHVRCSIIMLPKNSQFFHVRCNIIFFTKIFKLPHPMQQSCQNFFLSFFQIHSFKLLIPATSCLCAEGMEHWILAFRRFCQHFLTSLSKILATINVDHSNLVLPSFWIRPKVTSVPKAWSTETTLWDGFVSISSHRCPKFSQ